MRDAAGHLNGRRAHRRRRGMALLLVLTMVVLFSIIVVGMLVSARQEVATTGAYASGSDVRLLADTAANIVTAQITEATAVDEENGQPVAWTSQPGLIRTFRPSGQQKAYKLFSSYSMVEGSGYAPGDPGTLAREVPADWHSRPEEFVDLNRPVELHTQAEVRRIYPIVDAEAGGASAADALVEGFDFDASSVRAPAGTDPSANPLPMPVRWIYVTPEGDLVGAGDERKNRATARIAFWADDESCKVNINTASGGIFHDTPMSNTKEDHLFGRTQPIAQEYQRWPGHPSTTSLTPVLKPLRGIADAVERSRAAAALTPRIGWGGSQGATQMAWVTRNLGTIDSNRLFASVDELAFDQGLAQGRRVSYIIGGADLEDGEEKIDRLRFFLTAHSRAPELNLFNRPRVTLWPFNREMVGPSAAPAEAAKLTPEDRLIRFASELGGTDGRGNLDYSRRKRFYFQRVSAWDPAADWSGVPENRALFRYLQAMTSRPAPSADPSRSGGATLLSKYGLRNRDQILTEIWDYIRSQINTVNQAYQPVGFEPYSFPRGHDTEKSGFNDVAPLVIPDHQTKGFGRHPVLTQVIFQFYNAGEELEKAEDGTIIDQRDNDNPVNLTPDGVADYVVRRVRLVTLLQMEMPVNHLLASWSRFQISMKAAAAPFNFRTSPGDPRVPADLNAGLPEPILVRNRASGKSAWDSTLAGDSELNPAGIGFPAAPGDATFRTTTQVSAFHTVGSSNLSGSLAFGGLMRAPVDAAIRQDNKEAEEAHILKVMANRHILGAADASQLALFHPAGRQDVFYPFVSDVIEFRLPHRPSAGADKNVPAPGNFQNPPTDYFEALWEGGSVEIAIYPGLRDDAQALSPLADNWHEAAGAGYLSKTVIPVANAVIPLPRRGGEVGTQWNLGAWKPAPSPNFSELVSYYVRGKARYSDYLMNVPRRHWTVQMDVFRSYSLIGDAAPLHGDLRLAAVTRDIPSSWWDAHPLYETRGVFHGMSYTPKDMQNIPVPGDAREGGKVVIRAGDAGTNNPSTARRRLALLHSGQTEYKFSGERTASPTTKAAVRAGSPLGDFSLGYGNSAFGALVVGPDVGAVILENDVTSEAVSSPYIYQGISRAGTDDSAGTKNWNLNITGLLHSPFKQAPSPVIFGTLPSRAGDPAALGSWETLLFCPNPAGGRDSHRGWDAPRDHYLLDLFYMPAVEPYAITENFSTAGKVNLNYQIAPFSYIKRRTAMHALLESMTRRASPSFASGSGLVAIPESEAAASPADAFRSAAVDLADASEKSFRRHVDATRTLEAFDHRLDALNEPFVSPSEICEMFLIPEGHAGSAESFWADKGLTGDDKREMPYNHLYPRVTTRSNTFCVHFWVQTLKPQPASQPAAVAGEYRGSTVIERYLDPMLKDYGGSISDTASVNDMYPPLNGHYRFRKVEHRQFSP